MQGVLDSLTGYNLLRNSVRDGIDHYIQLCM